MAVKVDPSSLSHADSVAEVAGAARALQLPLASTTSPARNPFSVAGCIAASGASAISAI